MTLRRWPWQLLATVLGNAYGGFLTKSGLYRGWTKGLCFPGLNCSSCPAATMACPLGSLQQVLSSIRALPEPALRALFYVTGWLLLFGLVLGRFVCGWLCPFGLFQELLYKLPLGDKKRAPRRGRLLKYFILVFMVLALPLLLRDLTGYGKTWFCRLLCPAGTLQAGFFNLLLYHSLWALVGLLFYVKVAFFIFIVIFSVLYFRPFCALFCPLGALYGLFQQHLGLLRLRLRTEDCIRCGLCEEVCPMGLQIPSELDSAECIRCLNCVRICPSGGLRLEGLPLFLVDRSSRSGNKHSSCARTDGRLISYGR